MGMLSQETDAAKLKEMLSKWKMQQQFRSKAQAIPKHPQEKNRGTADGASKEVRKVNPVVWLPLPAES